MVHRSMTFDGVDLVEDLGLVYSNFSETLPERKIGVASIPFGADIDYTDTIGMYAYKNGTQVFVFMVYGDTEAERLRKKQTAIGFLHGKMADYVLSWEPEYTYTGRASVSVRHVSENVDVLTVTISRYPYKSSDEAISLFSGYPVSDYLDDDYVYDIRPYDLCDIAVTHLTRCAVYVDGKLKSDLAAVSAVTTETISDIRGLHIEIESHWYVSGRNMDDLRPTPQAYFDSNFTLTDGDLVTSVWGVDGTNVIDLDPSVTVIKRMAI